MCAMTSIKNKKRVVSIGDTIQFSRKGLILFGKVISIRDNTVLINISHDAAEELGYESNYTVVSHKNYLIV